MEYVREFRQLVMEVASVLHDKEADWSEQKPRNGTWSRKQILGHLVDSASINHGRFVRAQLQEEMVFPGYDQDAWVNAQGYRDVPWVGLVDLWKALNLHIARVMSLVPPDVAMRNRSGHNFHQIAWEVVPEGEGTTLDYLMRDYIAHLRYHLRQIDEQLAPPPQPQRSAAGEA